MYQPLTLGLLPNACASEGCDLAMSKESLTLDQNQTIGNCQAIALVTAEGGTYTVAAAVASKPGGNTGNGSVVLTGNGVGAGIQAGTYKIRFLSANAAELLHTDGSVAATEIVGGTPFVDQVKGQVNPGSTPFAAGDEFALVVTEVDPANVGKAKAWNPAATDGTEVFYGVAIHGETTGAGETKTFTAYTRNCRLWSQFINWNGATTQQIAAAVATAAKKNLIIV